MRWRRVVVPATAASAVWAGVNAAVQWRAFGSRRWGSEAGRGWTPEDVGLDHERLAVRTADGIDLLVWLLPGRHPGLVVISGGYRGRAGDVLGIGGALNRSGFTVVTFGWRGTPGSGRAAHTMGVLERRDLEAVVDAALVRTGPMPLGLLGYSMGAAVSICVAATDQRVGAVCADSSFTAPADVLGDGLRRVLRMPPRLFLPTVEALVARRTGARLAELHPLTAIAAIAPRPLLLIHGADDESIPVAHARRLHAAAGPTARLWLVPGALHVGAYFSDRAAYTTRVVDFFRTALLDGRGAGDGTPTAAHGARVDVTSRRDDPAMRTA